MTIDNAVASRLGFLEFLDRVGVGGLSTHPRRESFIHQGADILFSEVHVDSLSLMEIGIGLEEEYSLSLSPHELAKFTSVGALWEVAVRGSSREGA